MSKRTKITQADQPAAANYDLLCRTQGMINVEAADRGQSVD